MMPDDEEPLVARIWRQVYEGPDKERLKGDLEKRQRDLAKKLDRELDRNGWKIFVAGQTYGIVNGKAPKRRGAELLLVETIARWLADVRELLPERMKDFEMIVNTGMANPAPVSPPKATAQQQHRQD